MRKFKKLAKKAVAFSMATVLTWSGFLSSFMGSAFDPVSAMAAEVTGTKGADTFSWDNATVYFMLTDRFKNGDPSNDHSYGRGLDQNGNVINISDDRATFHGGDFAGVTQAIKEGYFTDLGVNAIWISAPYEQIHGYIVGGDGSPSFAHYSYHGYYVLDYTQTDANFGTAEEFKTLVDTAHENGIRIVLDIVLNHAGYNSLYDMNEYGFGDVAEGWDDYYFSMANVNNKDYHSFIKYTEQGGDPVLWSKWWGPDWIRAGLPGYTTSSDGSDLTQMLAGLPDFKTESTKTVGIPAFLEKKWKEEGRYDQEVSELKNFLSSNGYQMTVTNCISYWLSTWVREFGVDGFRCDTAKHVAKSEWKVLHDMCTKALKEWKAENPDKKLDDLEFWMTGEHWDHGVGYDEYYSVSGFDSMINFETTGGGLLDLGVVGGVYQSYADKINTKDGFNALSYMSSHDTTLARGDMKYLGSALLLLPGGVQIFYGDELARPKVGPDDSYAAGHCLRSDMNWDNYDEDVLAHWQKVGTFRNNHIAVGAGQNTNVTTSSGVGFTRTYSKNGITDRVAAVIGADANSSVTIDVSGVWKDGDVVTNYYDSSSATVKGGEVTFSAGANGTILIGDPDGKPLVTFTGDAKFKGTQTVKVNLKETTSAIVSVDGGRKFKVADGDTFTIGDKAYEGDTITITYKAENEKGTMNGKTTFYKAFNDEEFDEEEEEEVVIPSKLSVKMADGSAPRVHIWQGTNKNLTGAWPGKELTQKDSEGYYYIELSSLEGYDATKPFNVVVNNGGGQTGDIEGLKGDVKVDVSSSFTHSITGGEVDDSAKDNIITIRVKPYGSSVPHLYVWNGSGNYNGGFPGKALTEKDENGNYIFVVEGQATVNCIVSSGSDTNKSGDITGITGEVLITIKSESYGENTVQKTEKPESKFALMKKEAKLIKNMEASEYTSSSWKALYSLLTEADKLVAQREENADPAAVTDMYNKIIAAKKALVLSAPVVTKASTGSKVVKGVAAAESTVTVTIGGKEYTAVADECTGVWTITANTNLTSSSTIKTTATRESLSSATGNASLSSGNINIDNPYDDDNNNNDDNNDNNDNNNDDNVTSLSATSKASATSVVVGDSVKLTATATGGTGSYKYSYIVHNTTTGKWSRIKDKITSNTYTWKAESAGTRIFYIDVTDGSGKTVRATGITVVTTKTPTKELKVTSKVSDTTITVGDSIELTATATGGSGSYKYSYIVYNKTTGKWARIKDKITSNTYTWKAKSAGTRVFYIDVTDGSGKTVRATGITVKTTKANSIDVVASSTASSVSVGNTVSIIGTADGGTGSYTYSFVVYNEATNSWYRHAFSSSCVLNWKATSKGTRKFYVEAKDANGNVKRSEAVTITVK